MKKSAKPKPAADREPLYESGSEVVVINQFFTAIAWRRDDHIEARDVATNEQVTIANGIRLKYLRELRPESGPEWDEAEVLDGPHAGKTVRFFGPGSILNHDGFAAEMSHRRPEPPPKSRRMAG